MFNGKNNASHSDLVDGKERAELRREGDGYSIPTAQQRAQWAKARQDKQAQWERDVETARRQKREG